MMDAPYTVETSDAGATAFNDDLRIVTGGVDAEQAIAHFAQSLVVMLEYLPAGSPDRSPYETALAWFKAQGPLPVCTDCMPADQ